ncbi:unnamed protein product, partial [Rotaria magnacalcarata]
IHHPIDVITGLEHKDALTIGEKLGFRNDALKEVADTMMKLYDLFMKKDIILLEINPLTEAADGKIY